MFELTGMPDVDALLSRYRLNPAGLSHLPPQEMKCVSGTGSPVTSLYYFAYEPSMTAHVAVFGRLEVDLPEGDQGPVLPRLHAQLTNVTTTLGELNTPDLGWVSDSPEAGGMGCGISVRVGYVNPAGGRDKRELRVRQYAAALVFGKAFELIATNHWRQLTGAV